MGDGEEGILTAQGAFSLEGLRALVTGGGSGIGLGVARCMAAAGASVVLTGRDESKLEAAASSIGPAAGFLAHDITRLPGAAEFARKVEARFGPVDCLVNNAGNHLKKPVLETRDDEFQQIMQTHVNAAFALSREFGRGMLARRSGSLLFIASMASYLGVPQVSAYSTAKTSTLGLVRSLAAEFSPQGVRVNGIAPGWIRSEMLRRALDSDPERRQKILDRTPSRSFGRTDDIGWAAVYLASPAARFVTGVCLPVDGGAVTGF